MSAAVYVPLPLDADSTRSARNPSVRRPLRATDLVPDVVLAHRLAHGQALDLLEGLGVVDDQRAIHLPHAGQGVAAVLGDADEVRCGELVDEGMRTRVEVQRHVVTLVGRAHAVIPVIPFAEVRRPIAGVGGLEHPWNVELPPIDGRPALAIGLVFVAPGDVGEHGGSEKAEYGQDEREQDQNTTITFKSHAISIQQVVVQFFY